MNSARSLNVDNINKLTRYNPTAESTYGNKWTYKYPTTEEASVSTTGLTNNIWYKTVGADGTLVTDWINITRLDYTTFRLPEETTAISSTNTGSKEATHPSYSDNIPYDGLIITENSGPQWFASQVVFWQTWRVRFGVRLIDDGIKQNNFLFNSFGDGFECHDYRVRPIVSLTGTGDEVGTLSNMWKIS